ncbi:hypothetical protein [Pedobacter gandavensis]|uniref:hypothetical protein n=1 Tax=Pedobacter gandavensis TaxID=2679963 RepID=UPI00292F80DA|nr:hypothetical protein [Pedobacter gandavensis]
MEQTPKHNTPSMKRANETSIYKLMAVGIVISVLGVFMRFAGDSLALSLTAWAVLFIGSFIACKGVFKILAA